MTTREQTKQDYPQEINISEHVNVILKTIYLLDKPYTQAYVIRVLTGSEMYLKNELHKQLETFGSLEGEYGRLNGIFPYLVREGFILIKDSNWGTLELSGTGRAFLEDPREVIVPYEAIRIPWYDLHLKVELRELRKRLAEAGDIPPFQIFNDFAMQKLIDRKPLTETELRYIPGFLKMQAATAKQIIELVQKIMARKNMDEQTGIFTKAYSPSHRKVKILFEEGKTLQEIAAERELTEMTVKQYLSNLHIAGEVDFRPWIEANVDSQVLFKGTEYFKQVENPRMKEAKEVLGYDYDVLEMCRAYASQVDEPVEAYT